MSENIACPLVLVFVLMGIFGLAFRVGWVEASGTIYIGADGSVNPSTAHIISADNVTYTFTDDIIDSIVIQRSNIAIDGAGYKLQGTGSGTGIDISAPASGFPGNITIRNMEIVSFATGIWLSNAGNITVSANKIGICSDGIAFDESLNNNVISGNVIANNTNGIFFSYAQNNSIYSNSITNNEYGIYIVGTSAYNNTFYHNNFINNRDSVYWYLYEKPRNVWDDGYPSGGNYWCDYLTRYPNATEIDASGIGDRAYVLAANNTDRYPLMTQYVIPEFPAWTSIVPVFVVLTIAVTIVKRRPSKARASQVV